MTHIQNLVGIISAGCVYSDRQLLEIRPEVVIGFDHIKRRRLEEIEVTCHPGTKVGEYVPFYFCARSVMLYVISRRHQDLSYQGGQRQIVHLVTTVETAIDVATEGRWAYSDANAGAYYTIFYDDLERIGELIDWDAVNATNWSDPAVKEKKQAEFLVYDQFRWECIHQIGTQNNQVAEQVRAILRQSSHVPEVIVRPGWYY